ncbi:MAG: histidine ammonia-lyase [Myxococcota bacterium]
MYRTVTVGEPLGLDDLVAVADGKAPAVLGARGRDAMARARAAVVGLLRPDAAATYGINTGFGALAEIRIAAGDLAALQQNLVRSHAVGVGPALPARAVRAMMLIRAQALALGYSGVRAELVELLLGMLERGVVPVIPSQGSVGACGDLAPLAHLALVLIGEGHATLAGDAGGRPLPGGEALARVGLQPVALEAKEGLALINGTAAMLGIGGLALELADTLLATADVTGAMSLEALKGSSAPFDARIVEARPHPGAITVAARLRELLADSQIARSHVDCTEVQDAYSLRCMPQVHGSARDLVAYARRVATIELDSVTDNPLVLADGSIRSGGNFHGQPVAAAFDVASIALVDLASIAERRLAYLVDPHRNRGLPPFLAVQSGLHSGFMMAQVTAASLVAEARAMATPRSADSIPTSADREDHVSMGMTSARALAEIARMTGWVLAIEAVVAAQGIELRRLAPGRGVARALATVRTQVPPLGPDRALTPDFEAALTLIESGAIAAA